MPARRIHLHFRGCRSLRGGDAGKPRKRGEVAGGPQAGREPPRAAGGGPWPADAPSLKRALGGPSGRIFLNAAREIAGILEELVQREAERD